jgi:hypothetical protein
MPEHPAARDLALRGRIAAAVTVEGNADFEGEQLLTATNTSDAPCRAAALADRG